MLDGIESQKWGSVFLTFPCRAARQPHSTAPCTGTTIAMKSVDAQKHHFEYFVREFDRQPIMCRRFLFEFSEICVEAHWAYWGNVFYFFYL